MIRHALSMMGLPLPLDPDDPDVGRVDGAGNDSEEAEDDIDPEIDAEAFGEPLHKPKVSSRPIGKDFGGCGLEKNFIPRASRPEAVFYCQYHPRQL
jgi:hypothetical protein